MTARAANMYVPDTRARNGACSGSLQWSEYMFLAAVAIAQIVTVDPLHMDLDGRTLTKHAALMLTIPAVLLSAIAVRLSPKTSGLRRAALQRVFAVSWPLAILALLVVGGSLYARWIMGEHSTFLNLGVYMTILFAAALMTAESNDPDMLVRWFFGILVVGALVMGAYLVRYFRVTQVYHEQIFLVVPMAVWFAVGTKNRATAWGGTLLMLSMAYFSQKNTSYLVGLVTLAYLALVVWLPALNRKPALSRVFGYYLVMVVMLCGAAVLLYIWLHRAHYLPSGNPEYREHTYAAAWDHFMASPVWGTLFTAQSVAKFSLYTINIAGGRLPTHSDIMDLLSNGGVLGIGLWAYGLYRIGSFARKWLLRGATHAHRWAAYAHTLIAISLCAIVTYAFNPVVLSPGMAYMLWGSLGVLLGLAIRARREALIDISRSTKNNPQTAATA